MKIYNKPSGDVVLEVLPRRAGNFGLIRMSGVERSREEELRLARQIKGDIERHVDDIENIVIRNDERIYESENGNKYTSLYELLFNEIENDLDCYTCSSKHSENEKYKTKRNCYSFEELVETAFRYPYEFILNCGKLTDEQKEFLDKVIDTGKEKQMIYEN